MIYDDIINNINSDKIIDLTSNNTEDLYDYDKIITNLNILKQSLFNISIGYGGQAVIYSLLNNAIMFCKNDAFNFYLDLTNCHEIYDNYWIHDVDSFINKLEDLNNKFNTKMQDGILYFHQGWTDVINCLPLINYYCNLYNKIYLVVLEDKKEIVDFYSKSIKNIEILYLNKYILDNFNIMYYLRKEYNINTNELVCLFHGYPDIYRDNIYKDIFHLKFNPEQMCFVKCFYEFYNIPYITRINLFEFKRNNELEEIQYKDFINKYGENYILHHEIFEKDKNIDSNNNSIINLNGISNTFFDMIKVLENSKEIHLLDSVWGVFIYLLDAKYNLFKNRNIQIYLYPKRGYHMMFKEPLLLENWSFI
jgi:hypothetical protein